MDRDEVQQMINEALAGHSHDGNLSQQLEPKTSLFRFERQENPIHYLQIEVVEPATDTSTGDDKHLIHIPADWDRFFLTEVHAFVAIAGTTGTMDIQIRNATDSVDMLSTKITIDSGEIGSNTAATAAVINLSNDEIAENDSLRIDVDVVHTTAAKGLVVTLGFQEFRE